MSCCSPLSFGGDTFTLSGIFGTWKVGVTGSDSQSLPVYSISSSALVSCPLQFQSGQNDAGGPSWTCLFSPFAIEDAPPSSLPVCGPAQRRVVSSNEGSCMLLLLLSLLLSSVCPSQWSSPPVAASRSEEADEAVRKRILAAEYSLSVVVVEAAAAWCMAACQRKKRATYGGDSGRSSRQ